MSKLSQTLCIVLFLAFNCQAWAGQGIPDNLEDLGRAIDQIRSETNTPGIAVSLLLPDGSSWFHGSGVANKDDRTPVNQETQFRLGSVSKMLVGLSVLKLVDEGVLALEDKLTELVPEVTFDNPWEATHPLRLVHLLNHTSGWDAPHFSEQISPSDQPVGIRQVLEIHPQSRTSRWPPGTRSAYNNTGPLVAAYIVEKHTGKNYESFVQEQFFSPLSMNSSGFFYTDHYRTHAATLYRGPREVPYWQLNSRAAGGLNSSMADINHFLAFLLRRDTSPELLSDQALADFERPQASLATAAGVQLTGALGNNLYHANGQILYGHEGSLPGATAILIYQPSLQSGYAIAANSEGPAVPRVHALLAEFITQDREAPVVKPGRTITARDKRLSGFYRNISPVSALADSFLRLVPWSLRVSEHKAMLSIPFVGPPRLLIPDAANGFLQESTGKVVLVSAQDPVVGEVLHYGPFTLQKVGLFSAYFPRAVLMLWLISILIGALFALVWIPRSWIGKINNKASLRIRRWPMLTVIPLLVAAVASLVIRNSPAPFLLAGKPSVPSVLICLASLAFFLAALWSVRIWHLTRKDKMPWPVKWHSTLLIALNLIVASYLFSQGLIGVRLWA